MNSGTKFATILMLMLLGIGLDSHVSGSGGLTDENITGHVQRQFRMNVVLRQADIQVTTSSGVVTLEGSVASLVEKQRAEQLARQMPGVRGVINGLKIGAMAESPQSASRAIEQRLAADSLVGKRQLHATATHGTVSLTGVVGSSFEKSHAERLVRQLPGIEIVRNQLQVEPRSDELLRNSVLDAFEHNRRFESLLVDVRVEDQVVTLQGYVQSPQQRDLAEIRAGTIPGVRGVDNRLVVAYWPGVKYR